ncbi:T9SS type A sorting domain-containing protein [Flavobacterium subsaxonicum]|uniref:T9SS type A sorting domain-containing protein n=1 Tax=Flavobacterium subsaxonicum TaxID=426226 RepID=UPI00041F8FD5|nr:T9SS type A sorting domain-containing protein [Flavobacterium subsaxonicum]
MKKYLLLAILLSAKVTAQYADPNFPKPTSGYGADGSHSIATTTFNNPYFDGHNIVIYYPADVTTPVPTIFYSHAYGGNDPDNISGVLEFIAKKGYAVVFVPYQTANTTTTPQRYANLISGFRQAAFDYPDIIDTTKVGFLGHSFGGGASFAIETELSQIDGWGSNGRFIYALAQWYSYNLADSLNISLPTDTKVLIEIFNDDETNDHRMAIDAFNNINIAASEKDFLLVSSSIVNGYDYEAVHNLPSTSSTTAAFDALDYYAYYRLLAALCDYTFNGSLVGKNVALGHGSLAQVTMPTGMGNLQQYSSPTVVYPEENYEFPCSNDELNPRHEYCPESTELGLVMDTADHSKSAVTLYPNPADTALFIQTQQQNGLQVALYNNLGQQINAYTSATNNLTINVSNLQRGVYFILVNGTQQKFIKI